MTNMNMIFFSYRLFEDEQEVDISIFYRPLTAAPGWSHVRFCTAAITHPRHQAAELGLGMGWSVGPELGTYLRCI